jgi:hypothetical protein
MKESTTKDLMFKSAMYYCDKLGYSVIPVGRDKKPLMAWQEYQKRKPTKAEIMDWWLIKYPEANIGIVTGKISNLVIVDRDDLNIKHEVLDSIYDIAEPPSCTTPRDGMHMYFAYPNCEIRNTVNILEKVDIRGEGGYVLAPPSQNGNGKKYAWIKGRKITEVQITELPLPIIKLYNNINNNIYKEKLQKPYTDENPEKQKTKEKQRLTSESNATELLPDATDSRQKTTNTTKSALLTTDTTNYYTEGRRDEDLFHIANCLVKGGAEPHFIKRTIEALAMSCQPPFSLKEANEKFLSALNRQERKTRSLATDVEEYIKAQEGYFDAASIVRDLQLETKEEKKHLTVIIHRLKERGIIQPYGNKAGRYRTVVINSDVMDFMKAKTDEFPVNLPFGLSSMCKVYPGNIIVIAGTKSAGKTSMMLNIVKDNMNNLPIVYMNSEMGETELRIRLELFEDLALKDWKFTPVARASNWEDLITAEKKIFIIDYLDITDDLWKIGSIIKGIHEKLKDGICIIAIQRNAGATLGRGGSFSLEKARLYINLDYDYDEKCNHAKIHDCKAWRDRSPRGMSLRYKIHMGSEYTMIGGWHD